MRATALFLLLAPAAALRLTPRMAGASRRDALGAAAAALIGMPAVASAMPKGVRNGFEGKAPKGQQFTPGKGLREHEAYEVAMPKGVRNGFEGKAPKGQQFTPGKGLREHEAYEIAMPKGVRNGFEGKAPKGQQFTPGKGLRNNDGWLA
uniref:Uncharacterized protein n=1 Tax=Phaeomonas parva TaxID=124430 RepID=A0A7S1U3U6_9STRA|mmetsp:Transcript_29195/g.93490  ORF Transcript_29195/g.93490 Transcript_29195/m.93490 type:complete len:149 (+) Transcript_29195:274-720(+)